MIRTALVSRGCPLAIALIALIASQTPRAAWADDPPPYPPPPPPPSGGPPGYGPPIYVAQTYGPPVNGPEKITDFDDSQPVPYGYTLVSRRRKGLIIAGACVFGGVYGYTALGAAYAQEILLITGSNEDVSSLFIPVAGPFLELGHTDNAVARFGLVVDGVAQSLGAFMLLYGITTPSTILIRNDRLSIAPMVRPGASGLVVSGRF